MGRTQISDPLYLWLAKELPAQGTLLDLGCGRGRWLSVARHHGLDVFGVDSDAESVAECIKGGSPAAVSDIWDALDEHDSEYDVVTAFHLIEHLSPGEAQHLMHGIRKVLRPGGTCVIVTPNFKDWRMVSEVFWLDPTHIRPYPLALTEMLGEAAGLEHVRSTTVRKVQMGLRSHLSRPLNIARFGREYDRMNAVSILKRPTGS